ncbi:MAG: class I SAM-dependent methyltransferase [candidate division WOR-3 bacterium]|nr:MAG: class I SAM-dependent methyltransferase [candidate division WOR-3 bacterium]
MKVVEKSWNEFWAYYWRVEDRHRIPGIFEWDKRIVNFIEYVCGLKPPAHILDLACGGGDQAKVFARKGYEIVGIDIAPSLIEFAQAQFLKENLKGNFIVGDMRDINYKEEFDTCVILSGSFGFFGDIDDQRLLVSIRKALKVGGKVFIMFISANEHVDHTRTWRDLEYGWELGETWFDNEACVHCGTSAIIRRDGTMIVPKKEPGYHANERIRCYTIPEMRTMFAKAGLEYSASYSSRYLEVPPKTVPKGAIRNIVVGERKV